MRSAAIGPWVGRDLPRPDGPAKVTGAARYVADLDVPGAWIGATVRSQVACGELLAIDCDPAAFAATGAVLVQAGDLQGRNRVALIADDQPVLVERAIAHWGEPLVLVAAPTAAQLARALACVRPQVRELPAQFEPEASDRTFRRIEFARGDVEAVFANGAAQVVVGTYHTDSQEQLYIEPQGCIAWPPDADGTVVVRGSLQCPYYVQKALCAALALPPERARVIACAVGGGFGGKEEYPSVVAVHAALLARRAGAPVRLIYDRHEDLAVTPKRHPSRVRHRTAVAADGTLLAMDIDVLLDGGAYTTLSPVVLSRAVLHATGPYRCANVRVRGRVVATNHVPYGAFRGFGAPQVCFAIERQMDRIARTLGCAPFALRRRNAYAAGDITATGQRLDAVASTEVLDAIAARTGCDRPATATALAAGRRRGRGLSFFWHGAGFTGAGEEMLKSVVAVRGAADGRVHVRAAATEIGQGTQAMFVAIAAECLGCAPADVTIDDADTGLVPDSGPTVASRTCMVVGGLVARACRELRQRVGDDPRPFRARLAAFVGAGGDAVVTRRYAPPVGLHWDDANFRGDAYPTYAWAADYVEVEIDLATFALTCRRFVSAVDVGRAIQPLLVTGQLEGGSLQALGWGHLEKITTRAGRFLEDRLATCIVPTAVDAPTMAIELIEVPFAHGPFGAKGIGELPMDGGAPALAAAIEDALGIVCDHAPMTPERLLDAWLAAHPDERLDLTGPRDAAAV